MTFTRITVNPEQMGGVPCIRGLRIPVATVIGMVAEGMSHTEILQGYPDLELEDIREALSYAAEAVRERELGVPTMEAARARGVNPWLTERRQLLTGLVREHLSRYPGDWFSAYELARVIREQKALPLTDDERERLARALETSDRDEELLANALSAVRLLVDRLEDSTPDRPSSTNLIG